MLIVRYLGVNSSFKQVINGKYKMNHQWFVVEISDALSIHHYITALYKNWFVLLYFYWKQWRLVAIGHVWDRLSSGFTVAPSGFYFFTFKEALMGFLCDDLVNSSMHDWLHSFMLYFVSENLSKLRLKWCRNFYICSNVNTFVWHVVDVLIQGHLQKCFSIPRAAIKSFLYYCLTLVIALTCSR